MILDDLKGLREFGRFLSFRNKRRLTIGVIALAIIPSTLLFYLPVEIRYLYAIGLTLLATVPIYSTVQMVTGSVIQLIRIALYNRKHKPKEVHFPEVKSIAKKMGLAYDKSIYVTENPHVKSAYVNLFSKKITIPSSSFTECHRSEILAIVGHELGHIKNNGKYRKEILLASFAPFVLIVGLVFVTQFFALAYIPVFIQIGSYSLMMLILSYVFWRNEYRADEESAKTVGAAPLIAVFELFQSKVKKDEGSDTHPPLHDRIKRLESFL
jgi:Zn-dependent protease with chaperone function